MASASPSRHLPRQKRSGFIIGIGLGPGYTSYSAVPDRVSKTGVAFDFHIGGVVDEFELFYAAKANIFGSDVSAIDQLASGVNVIGFAYPLTPEFSITGGIGLGVWVESRSSVTTNDSDGIGLLGGGRYQLGDSGRWMLNFDMMYGEANDQPQRVWCPGHDQRRESLVPVATG